MKTSYRNTLLAVSASLALQAANASTWTGGGANSNWGTAGNWDTLPSGTVDLVFNGSTRPTNTNNITGLTASSITFNSGAAAFTLGGSNAIPMVLGGNIINNSSNNQTISMPLSLTTGPREVDTGSAGITLGAGSGHSGQVSLSGSYSLTKKGSGILTLMGSSSSFTGGVIVDQGTLRFGHNDVFGNTGTTGRAVTANNGTIVTNTAGFYTVLSDLTLNDAQLGANSGANDTYQAFKITGSVTVTGSSSIVASGANSGVHVGTNPAGSQAAFHINGSSSTLTVGAALINATFPLASTGIIKDGAGTMTLNAGVTHTYTGATTVSADTLYVNGSLGNTPVSVAASATIGGTGSIGGSLALSGTSLLGVVDPGDALAVTGNVTFGSGFGIDNITGWDIANASPGTYTVLSGSNINFANLDHFGGDNAYDFGNGTTAYFQSGGGLQVVVIPEVSTILSAALGLPLLLRRRRTGV